MEYCFEEERNKPSSKSMHLEYIYYLPIEDVWEELKDIPKWKSKQSFFTNFEIVNGERSWDIGSRYKFVYKDCAHFLYETKKVYEDEFMKQIVIECVENLMTGIGFYSEYNLYKNTFENYTLLTYDLHHVQEIGFVLLHLIGFEKNQLFKINNKFLRKNRKFETEQVESCILKKDKTYLWNLITDFNLFSKLIPTIADKVIVKDEKLSLNSEVMINFIKEDLVVSLKVDVFQNGDKAKKWKLGFTILDLDKSNNKNKKSKKEFYTPYQKISFEIYDVDSSSCSKFMFIFRHTFKKNKITKDNLKILEYDKIMTMKKLKKYCSKN